MNSVENINRKKKLFDYVIKVTSDTLDLINSPDDILLVSLRCFIYNNLGIHVTLNYRRKYCTLDDIQYLFEERSEKITSNNLDKLELKLTGLDRNIQDNIDSVKDFIFENYNIQISECYLCPSIDTQSIIDRVIDSI